MVMIWVCMVMIRVCIKIGRPSKAPLQEGKEQNPLLWGPPIKMHIHMHLSFYVLRACEKPCDESAPFFDTKSSSGNTWPVSF